MITIYSGWLIIATIAETATVDNIITQGATLGNLSGACIWALVALVSVIGLIKLYRDKQRDDQDLKGIIKETTVAIVKNTETLEKLSEKIDSCPNK
jgi:hypothetical protein